MRLREKLKALRQRERPRVLIVTAVAAEREAVVAGLELAEDGAAIVVLAGGVGPAAAAATAARSLAIGHPSGSPFDAVVSVGIGGGIAGRAAVGATVLATRSIAADLGADSAKGFLSLTDLGFGSSTVEVDLWLLDHLRTALPRAVVGDVLTVSTVTGTAQRAATLSGRHPAAVAEAMEGFGVACAAAQAATAFAEIRTISNVVGPRDRKAWRVADALVALTDAARALDSLHR